MTKKSLTYSERLRGIIFPIEGFFFLYLFSYLFQTTFYQQYYFQYFAGQKLYSFPNYTNDSNQTDDVCLTQDFVVDFIGNASFVALQKQINMLNMYTNLVLISTSFFSSLMLGSLSDRLGRKPVVAVAVIGAIISSILQVLIVYFEWSVYFFLLVLAVNGITGSFPLVCGISFAIGIDTTSKKWVGVRQSFLEASIAISRAIVSISTNNWIQSNNCSFSPPSILSLAVSVLTLVYLVFMPETAPYKSAVKDKQTIKEINISATHRRRKKILVSELFTGLKIYFNPFYVGFSNWWRMWVITIVICLVCACSVGGVEILNFFLHNKPLEWSYDIIGYYGAATSGFAGIVLVFLSPLLIVVGRYLVKLLSRSSFELSHDIPYILIGLIGVFSGLTANVMVALARKSWKVYVAGVFFGAQQVSYPMMRVLLERCVFTIDRGALFSICSSFKMLISIFASVVYNEVYRPETVVDGHTVSASTVFWIMTAFWAACVPLIFLLFIKKNDKLVDDSESIESSQTADSEKEPLLSNKHIQ